MAGGLPVVALVGCGFGDGVGSGVWMLEGMRMYVSGGAGGLGMNLVVVLGLCSWLVAAARLAAS